MTDQTQRLNAIAAAMAVTRAAINDDPTPIEVDADLSDVLLELAAFTASEAARAALWHGLTALEEVDEYEARAIEALGIPAPIVRLVTEPQ